LAFEVIEDKENPLLNRREIVCLFPSSAGKITRADVVKAVSQKLNVSAEKVVPIRIEHSHGIRDTKATIYIFNNPEDAKRQLPKHILLRLLPKEERKKLLEQKRKPKKEEKK
jgi:small subunit ribosomal protein S24e